jgi:hypothetical protein
VTQRPNLPPNQPVHHQVQIGGKIRLACGRSRRIGAHHKQATRREHAKIPAHEHTKTSFHPVANHSGPNRATDYESYLGWLAVLRLALGRGLSTWGHGLRRREQVPGHGRPTGARALAHREGELRAVPHPGFAG